jgi:HAD superfamily hydrolase (TIGR01509 family)
MKRISCVIFDVDGTLTSTNDLIYGSFNHVAERHLNKTFTNAEITAMWGPTEEVALERMVGMDKAPQAIEDYMRFYAHNHTNMVDLYKGMREIIDFLKEHGVALAVFTGKGRRSALYTLEQMGIKEYFEVIVSGDDVTKSKPSPEGILKIVKSLKVDPDEALMVGDAVSDVLAAHDAGVHAAAVLWDSYGKERIMGMDVEYKFHSVAEFSAWLHAMFSSSEGSH